MPNPEQIVTIIDGDPIYPKLNFNFDIVKALLPTQAQKDALAAGALAANAIVSAEEPAEPSQGLIWLDTTNNSLKIWDTDHWVTIIGGSSGVTGGFIGARVNRDAVQLITTGGDGDVLTPVILADVISNDDGFWSGGAPTRVTVPVGKGGTYVLLGKVFFTDDNLLETKRTIVFRKNGTDIAGRTFHIVGPAKAAEFPAFTFLDLEEGDYVELCVDVGEEYPSNIYATKFSVGLFGATTSSGDGGGGETVDKYYRLSEAPEPLGDYDDNFDGPTLDSKWAIYKTETDPADYEFERGRLVIKQKEGVNFGGVFIGQTPPSGNYIARTKIDLTTDFYGSDTGHCGIGARDSGGNVRRFSWRKTSVGYSINHFFSYPDGHEGDAFVTVTSTPHAAELWMEMEYNGSNYKFRWSADGTNWNYIATSTITAAQIGIMIGDGAVARYPTEVGIDFFYVIPLP